jgi:hypothetical protein
MYSEIIDELKNSPEFTKEMIAEVESTFYHVEKFFDSDVVKTILWFNTKNPMLGDIAPMDLIRLGKYEKLNKFVTSSLDQ